MRFVLITLLYVIIFICSGMLIIPGFSEKVTLFGYQVIPLIAAFASITVMFLIFNLLKCQRLVTNDKK
jgi:hypothetical protein